MQAVVKTHHININIKADNIPNKIINFLKKEYGKDLIVTKKENKNNMPIVAQETSWYEQIKNSITPADNLKIYRQNMKISQGKLAKMIGILPTHVSEMERGKRGISKSMAKKLAQIFEVGVEKFI